MKNRVFLKTKLFSLHLIVYCRGKVSDLQDDVLFSNTKTKPWQITAGQTARKITISRLISL